MTEVLQEAQGATIDSVEKASNWYQKNYNKIKVGVTGGLTTAVGLVLIPAPVPVGAIVTAYGVSILATEFEGAEAALDKAKKGMEGGLESLAKNLKVEDDEEEEAKSEKSVDKQESDSTTKPTAEEDSSSATTGSGEEMEAARGVDKDDTTKENAEVNEEKEESDTDKVVRSVVGKTEEDKVWEKRVMRARNATSNWLATKVLPALQNWDTTPKSQKHSNPQSIALEEQDEGVEVEISTEADAAASSAKPMAAPESTPSLASTDSTISSSDESNFSVEEEEDYVTVSKDLKMEEGACDKIEPTELDVVAM